MANAFLIASVFTTMLTVNVESFVPFQIGRVMFGLTVGLSSGIASIYSFEIAPRNLRGAACTLHQVFLTLGFCLTNVFGLPTYLGTSERWPHLYTVTLKISILNLALLPFCCETPEFLFGQRDDPNETDRSICDFH